MIDLTGGHLATFLLGELLPVISKHPRFRDNDGSVASAFSNLILYKDVSLTLGNLRATGQRQSPDYFMCTLLGRACAAKLEGHSGAFLEWIRETDPDGAAPPSGIYYLAVDAVNEETREVRFVQEAYRWLEGRTEQAVGSRIYLDYTIPDGVVEPTDPTVEFKEEGSVLTIFTYTPTLALRRTDTGEPLVPGRDYWVFLEERHHLTNHPGGAATGLEVPTGWVTLEVVDDLGFHLRAGQDWDWVAEDRIRFAPWVMAGSYHVEGVFRRAPSGDMHVHPENVITVAVAGDEELVPEQTRYVLARGEFHELVKLTDTTMVFKHLMAPGDRCRWEARIRTPQVFKTAYKMAVNPDFLPGLELAIGDQVVPGDQAAIIVAPSRCETYEVYGAKDAVSFDINIKSNDLTTSTELGGLVRSYLLIEGRDRLESLGLSIFEAGSGYQGEARDGSGTTASHTVIVSVQAMADWEYHKPLVNRVDDIEVSFLPDVITYPGAPRIAPALVAFGVSRFTPAYQ